MMAPLASMSWVLQDLLAGGAILVMIALGVVDARTRRLPNALTALLALLILSWAFVDSYTSQTWMPAVRAALWMTGTFLTLTVIESIWRRLRHQAGLGMGDIKMIAALAGLFWGDVLVVIAVACLIASVVAILRRRSDFPFGPYLSACAIVCMGMSQFWSVPIFWV